MHEIRGTQARRFLLNLSAVSLLNETNGYIGVNLHEK